MSEHSGTKALVDGQSAVKWWEVEHEKPSPPKLDSAGGTAEHYHCGVEDWRGFFIGNGYQPTVLPGDDFEFEGVVDEVSSGPSVYKGASGTAIVDRIIITWQPRINDLIEYRVDFSGNDLNGLDLEGVITTPADAADPVYACVQDMTVEVGGTDVTQMESFRLVLQARNKGFVHSETNGVRLRTPGAIGGAFEFKRLFDNAQAFTALKTPAVYKFNVTDTLFWQLTYGEVHHIKNFGTNLESDENVTALVQGVFSGMDGTTQGSIVLPDTVEWWPTDGR